MEKSKFIIFCKDSSCDKDENTDCVLGFCDTKEEVKKAVSQLSKKLMKEIHDKEKDINVYLDNQDSGNLIKIFKQSTGYVFNGLIYLAYTIRVKETSKMEI
jgi:hypothetical protein